MFYYGPELLDQIRDAYRHRADAAVERGFNQPSSKYLWLYRELEFRLNFLHRTVLFLDALPKFISEGKEEEALGYVVHYVSALFSRENCGNVEEKDGKHPFFSDCNLYYRDFNESLNHFDREYDLKNHPLLYVDLSECTVRAARLYLQIREKQFHAIDRDNFDPLMQMREQIPDSA